MTKSQYNHFVTKAVVIVCGLFTCLALPGCNYQGRQEPSASPDTIAQQSAEQVLAFPQDKEQAETAAGKLFFRRKPNRDPVHEEAAFEILLGNKIIAKETAFDVSIRGVVNFADEKVILLAIITESYEIGMLDVNGNDNGTPCEYRFLTIKPTGGYKLTRRIARTGPAKVMQVDQAITLEFPILRKGEETEFWRYTNGELKKIPTPAMDK